MTSDWLWLDADKVNPTFECPVEVISALYGACYGPLLLGVRKFLVSSPPHGDNRECPQVCSGSTWLCENADTETISAIIESGRRRGRIIVSAKASFLIHYFISVSRILFSHSLGHLRTIRAAILSVRT